ncbi:hypothetical protein, variant [Puccinia graminis f. sp. tritici CRL 75-36-700-3]|uniref:Uncharacterized protein n=1 Tax=Puccinia graminis f. sp. tritici (strain CRL 75-36-700-3 / race SCCL) TaxID=418459 RepID=E3KE07_PUCGT|nr:uncharacterized protein PGTG_08320 [Puccinia graminis f. sp. tritici CRL 75-36-700-3]XP_003889889.1 hypothetical protein, variant [Puccinia graminis f. sp. tritici CRL 75-36-700-3]EFP82364.1 hypothetical protein PGTG_08320 [Puccinia graminis f. sp. tritici CRL 75-36-700-3]EHS63245.1 hypothetical protein, variant [Puccinia graminis f. sp. tritici CRL 75-36-700-3]
MRSVIVAVCLLAAAAMASPVELQARKPCGISCGSPYYNGGNNGGFAYDSTHATDNSFHNADSTFAYGPNGIYSNSRDQSGAASTYDHTSVSSYPSNDNIPDIRVL